MPGIFHPGPSGSLVTIAKADADITGGPIRGLYVGGTGDVVVMDIDGNIVTFSAVPVGTVLPIAVKQVRNATTATLMVGLR